MKWDSFKIKLTNIIEKEFVNKQWVGKECVEKEWIEKEWVEKLQKGWIENK
jgi:hypothetical protein